MQGRIKKIPPRISIAGRLIADLLKTAVADRVLTMDLHADSVHGFLIMPVEHLTAMPGCGFISRVWDGLIWTPPMPLLPGRPTR